jgi:hypothetical protein
MAIVPYVFGENCRSETSLSCVMEFYVNLIDAQLQINRSYLQFLQLKGDLFNPVFG